METIPWRWWFRDWTASPIDRVFERLNFQPNEINALDLDRKTIMNTWDREELIPLPLFLVVSMFWPQSTKVMVGF
jgi:hypothetical protein